MKIKFSKAIALVLTMIILFTSFMTSCGKKAKTGDFYVKYGATGNGLSADSPAPSVNAVKKVINEQLGEGDIANVWIIGDDSEDFNPFAFKEESGEEKSHQMNVWKNSNEKNISHAAKVVVQTYIPKGKSAENTQKEYVAFSEKVGKDSILELTGPTEFKNVILVPTATTDKIDLAGNDATFANNVTFRCIALKDGEAYADWQEVTLSEFQSDFNTVLTNSKKVNENSFKATFNNVPFNCGNLTIPADKEISAEFKEDVTIAYTKENLASLKITFGAPATEKGQEYSAIFYKNLNVKMKKGDAVRIWPGKTDIRVDGGAQFIVDPKTTFYSPNDKEYSFENLTNLKSVSKDGKKTDAKKWILYIDSAEQDHIHFAEGEAGVFTLDKGYMAVAVSKDGKTEILSKREKLVLEKSGEYNVTVTQDYTNNGEKIKVYKKTEIDLGAVSHTEKEGYAFVGWKTDKGKYPERTQKFSKGTVLTAQYVPLNFAVSENKIKEGAAGEHSLVFVFKKGKDFYNKLPKPLEYGSIYLPTDATLGAQMHINEPITLTWKWNKDTGFDFEPLLTGRTPLRDKAWKTGGKANGNAEEYTLTIGEIDPDNYYTWYSVRGYIIYEDHNGLQRIVYSKQDNPNFEKGSNFDNDQSCLYEVAEETPDDKKGELENEIISYVQGQREDYYHQATGILQYYSGFSGMGLKDESPLNKSYKLSNGITVRDVTITTGKNTEKTEICFITDPHFAALDKKDIDDNITNAISSYRGRTWTNGTSFRDASIKYMEYASLFDKTVIGGDAVDYLTYGSIGAVARLITKKSVNGSIKMVLGNHEPSEMSQNDISGLSMQNSIEERYKLLNNNWTNDVEYSSEIMKTKDGKDNLMLIYLDNGGKKGYNENQLKKYKADIAVAREKGLPVLIFQHIPLGTGETNYKDEPSINLYNEIRKSSDVVKGVFCGHIHETSLTYLEGLNQDGSANNVKIPQYSGAGAHYNNVMKITVE